MSPPIIALGVRHVNDYGPLELEGGSRDLEWLRERPPLRLRSTELSRRLVRDNVTIGVRYSQFPLVIIITLISPLMIIILVHRISSSPHLI